MLVNEFKYIFSDLFGRRGEIYQKIVEYLVKGPAEFEEIALGIKYSSGGALSNYLNELIVSGFLKKDHTWNLKGGSDSKLSKYRLRDNYLRFFLRYMSPKLSRIKNGQFSDIELSGLSGFQSMLGLQFENLVLNNRNSILNALNIKPDEVVYDNPFFQHKTTRQRGCQVDYLIQTKYNTLYVCEVKFSRNEIKSNVIQQLKKKVSRISVPRGFACIPVLIHTSGIEDEVEDSDYFGRIINFSELLEK